jgi:CheY-like chemotaxis protein/HPt (histidine-containing phosphotransfer) domain-containing protein
MEQMESVRREQLRVLIVDDVEANRLLAQALLRRFGHKSEVATSGFEALEKAVAGQFEVVLMDVEMPGMDGMEAARRIRERLGAAAPRIIAITANALSGDRERCLAAGMDDYLSKPIQMEALRAAIERAGVGTPDPAIPPAEPAPAPVPAAIDWRRIESFKPFDPDGGMVAGVIAAFLADAPGRIRTIRETLASGDADGLAAAAHALKGAAANIGAARLQTLLHDIESRAREGRLASTAGSIGALDASLAETATALAAKGKLSPGS